MKNKEYITMPSPELVEEYVKKSQIDLLKKIKQEIVDDTEQQAEGMEEYVFVKGFRQRAIEDLNIINKYIEKIEGCCKKEGGY